MSIRRLMEHVQNKADQKQKSLWFSYFDGIFAACMIGFTQDYFIPFLLFLNGTARQVGALNSLPNLFAALVQLKSAELTERWRSRKKMIIVFVFLQAVMVLLMGIIAICGAMTPAVLILLVILFCSFGAVANPAWGSLMSDLVPDHIRGEYFGWRNRNIGIATIAATFIAGVILYYMKRINVLYGFVIIFMLAFVCRSISWLYLNRMHDPHTEKSPDSYFTLINFLSRLKESNFARFVIFVALMNFSVNIAAPYFAVLMLRDLGFNYVIYSIINITATLTVLLTIRRWGQHADKIGNLKVITFTAPLIGFIPLLWILNRSLFVIIPAQIFSGFLWAGFNLSCSNFIFDAVTPAKRIRCIAYFNLINGVALCAGSLLGGFIVSYLPALCGYTILSLFLISSLARIVVGLAMQRILKEVRPIEHINNNQLFFSMVGIRPLLGIERKTIRY